MINTEVMKSEKDQKKTSASQKGSSTTSGKDQKSGEPKKKLRFFS
jgi:hypothetical protein